MRLKVPPPAQPVNGILRSSLRLFDRPMTRSPDRPMFYSYLNASTGSSFEARMAGTSPLITPTTNNTRVETASVSIEIRK
jgi:hypothetical protein